MKNLIVVLTGFLFVAGAGGQTSDYAKWVNPFIGTGGHGHTFPGATVPFGMVQLSPDTRIDNWDGSSGYHYSDDVIYGFSHTHLSGTGIPDGCDILIKPTVNQNPFVRISGNASAYNQPLKFSHANETAEPGFYSVHLDNGIFAEITATTRAGLHRYTFPRGSRALLEVDLRWRDKLLGSEIRLVNDNQRIEGFRKSSSWSKNQTVYFVIDFSRSITASWTSGILLDEGDFKNKRAFLRFPTDDVGRDNGEPLLVKVGISHVSIEGARKNLETELPHWDFDRVRREARSAWNKELSKIEVSGGTPEQTTNFYTALYHTMIHPNVFNDVDGRYKGHDGKVHQLPGYQMQKPARSKGTPQERTTPSARSGGHPFSVRRGASDHYTVFSLWDTFRAAHPLYTIIDQRRTVDFINTFIRQYEQGGRLPVWELWGEETDTMIGYHSVSVIADAMAKGIKGFDYEKAYKAAKHSAELDHFGLAAYTRRGYVSMEDENESVSRTLEYAYNDWCLMSMGSTLYNLRSLNKVGSGPNDAAYLKALEKDIDRYRDRSRYFENLFEKKTGFFRAKKNGGFVEPFAPSEVNFGFTEGNSWQYSFFVPHDVTRLMSLMGGDRRFVAKLDELFTTDQKLTGREQADLTGLIGQYAHGNEPSHHIAYLYNYAGEPWKTQKYVRKIMDEFYRNAPDGLIGNEDCGQMSAWFVLSASGFYPVTPGDSRYDIGTPLFKQVTYNLENGKKFIVRAPTVSSTNIYVARARWNGAPIEAPFFTHNHINGGGVLSFEMTDKPVKDAFRYSSTSTVDQTSTSVPSIEGERTFAKSAAVTMSTTAARGVIRYTLDGSVPTPGSPQYTGAISLDRTTTVKAIALLGEFRSPIVESVFTKRENDWTVTVASGYSTQYTGGGDNAIVDGIRGTTNFASGEWQGVQGKTYEAIIDLKRDTAIRELGASFLQVAGPWIWMPDRVEFELSDDGVNFRRSAEIKPAFAQREMTPTLKEFTQAVSPTRARYVRLRAYNFGKIPAWHPGAGGDPWIFIDEVIIK